VFCTKPLSRCRVGPNSSTKISKPLNSTMLRLERRRMPFSTPDTAAMVATVLITMITINRLVLLCSMPNRFSRPDDTCSEPIPRFVTSPSRVTNMPKNFGMFVTLLGLVTNLGIGSLQVSSGLENLFGMEHSNTNLLIVIIVMSTVATIAAVSGVENGIRRLSNLNIVLFSGLLIFVLLFGPTLHLLNGLVQNTGDYLNGIVLKTFDLYVYEGDADKTERWMGLWTLFYWAWWISWAPFVGMFIARISRGRTVRELVAGVLLIPLGFTLAWLSIFGNTALDLVMNQGVAELGRTALTQPSMAIYQLLDQYPASKIVIGVSIFVGFVLFLTPADSGAVIMANLSCKGGDVDEDAPHWLRIFWSAVITLVTIGLLFAGNFEAMQTMVVLAGLPFSAVLVLFMFGLLKAMRKDIKVEKEQAEREAHALAQEQIRREVQIQVESHRQLLGRVLAEA